jgi:hypothetical protein
MQVTQQQQKSSSNLEHAKFQVNTQQFNCTYLIDSHREKNNKPGSLGNLAEL